VAEDRMSIGDLISFYAVLGLLRAQLQIGAVTVPLAVSGMESLSRLQDFLSEDAREPYDGSRRIEFAGAVELRGVSFSYEPGRPVLREVDLRVAPGETVLLLGQNGAGKSTIINLVAGLYAPASGVVEADGVPLGELEMASLRAQMGVVPQDPLMLPGTVRENIAFGRPDATDAEVDSAAARAGAAELVASLPEGYRTALGDEGVRLSGGQRQRIALARALLGDPRLLMLDEPSTHLDRDGTQSLLLSLRERGGPAVLLVSHEVELTDAADRVLELRDGAVTERAAAGGAAL
jgi:ATP-binding cassette subfamily B protein